MSRSGAEIVRLEAAAQRLERALSRLEAALARQPGPAQDAAPARLAGEIAFHLDAALAKIDRILAEEG